ncbi:WD40 repeat-like protein [Suillus brevipes Sb2]|nr:WD40 repeat-like protein [Suillus brevipes Sb2]
MSQLIPNTTPLRTFEDHEDVVHAVAVFPDMRRMVTGSWDETLRIWDLETGVVLKKMEGHSSKVWALAVSPDGQIIAGSDGGEIFAWHGENGESLTQPIEAHSDDIYSVDFSSDGTVLATGSDDGMTKFWCTKTWQMQGDPIHSTVMLMPAAFDIRRTRERVASFKGHTKHNLSLAWTPDGTRLLSGGGEDDPTIREWDPLTWQQIGQPWEGHTSTIYVIVIDPTGTLVASASFDKYVRLWRLSDRQQIGVFEHSFPGKTGHGLNRWNRVKYDEFGSNIFRYTITPGNLQHFQQIFYSSSIASYYLPQI